MPKRARRKRLAKMIAEGKTPFNCRHCAAIFANDRDRVHHEEDAHLRPQHPAAQARKEARMSRHHQHQHTTPPARGNVLTRVFRKESDEMYQIDYVTPLASQQCAKRNCAHYALPVTGFCEKHDPVCRAIVMARIIAQVKAEEAKLPAIVRSIAPNGPRNLISANDVAAAEAADRTSMEDLANWNHFH